MEGILRSKNKRLRWSWETNAYCHDLEFSGCTLYALRLRALYTPSYNERFYFVTSYLKEKLIKLRSFDRQKRRLQNCPFQSSFTQRTAQFTQGIPQFPQFTSFYPPWPHTKEDTQNWQKKLKNMMGNLCYAREHLVQFFVQFFLHS